MDVQHRDPEAGEVTKEYRDGLWGFLHMKLTNHLQGYTIKYYTICKGTQ